MNVPKRSNRAPSEAEGELQSLDVLALAPMKQGGTAGHPDASKSSIAPVGLDFLPMRGGSEEPSRPVREAPPPARRRHTGLVIGLVAGCALILVAAGIARVGHASSAPSPAAATATDVTAPASEPLPANATPSPAAATPNAVPAPAVPDASSSTGTVRLAHGVSPNRVLFDGKKLSSSSAVVSCGTHQIKVGRGRAHSLDVPCGGAIDVTK
jgi:hypothetical protein